MAKPLRLCKGESIAIVVRPIRCRAGQGIAILKPTQQVAVLAAS
jgi:hypothetical protein